MKIPIKKQIFDENDLIAQENRNFFRDHNISSFNIMASPGAGKTSIIIALRRSLPEKLKMGVVEGDPSSRIDSDRLISYGIPAVQINTGGGCHLDAFMLKKALSENHFGEQSIIFVENVGNLVCPANFDLGTGKNIVISSVPEGDDKPYKYPSIFAKADLVVLNKMDLSEVFGFRLEYFTKGLKIINQNAELFLTSCKTNQGISKLSGKILWYHTNS